MSRSIEPPEVAHDPLLPEHLPEFFSRAAKPDTATHRIGTELEKFGVVLGPDTDASPSPVRFARHVEPILADLCAHHGWTAGASRGTEGQLVELIRDGASITLEPGCQLELSGAPLPTVHHTCAEFTQHFEELDAVSRPRQVAWLAAGFHPFATHEEIDWVPKARYAIMKGYLPTRGRRALDMMARTCTVQANFDYRNEVECGERFRLALKVGPLVTAMFANSPFREGKLAGRCSERTAVWYDVDPDRCGIPAFMFDGGTFSYQRYVDWALDIPMFFVQRGEKLWPHHATFRQFMADGFTDPEGTHHAPVRGDWALHLSTLFPEVRLKPFVEVRTADAVPSRFVCGMPALWKGILYDDDALAAANTLVESYTVDDLRQMWVEARRVGVRSPRIQDLCRRLLTTARAGLERQDVRDSRDRTEARFLDALEEVVEQGRSPADTVVAALGELDGRSPEGRRELVRAFYFAGAEA